MGEWSVQQADTPCELTYLGSIRRLGPLHERGDQATSHVAALKVLRAEPLGLQ